MIIGTHGLAASPTALLGSVAEKIVRTATVPVLTIHGSAHKTPTAAKERIPRNVS